ncbi:MAG: diacylglycerol kinase family lipid kinase [Acidobacteriota bacterium]|nr:diacylglycerol kinase family lipid kinase [Acidobacteriota bacterium]
MKATVVVNPIAGPGRSRTLDACAALARESLGRAGFEVDVHITTGPDDAQRFAAAAVSAGHTLVAAWGGDGTVNGVGAGLAGSPVAMAIIPGGSGNGLARDLGVPLDAAAAFEVAATGTTRSIDAGELDGSLFFNVAGIGLDASIANRMALPGARRGLLGYVVATMSELPAYRARDYAITFPESEAAPMASPALFVALANSRQYGNGAQIAPHALLDDGQIDVVLVRPLSLIGMASRIPAFFNGTLKADESVLMRTAAQAAISSDSDIWFHVDGEPRRGSKTIQLRTRPRTLVVRVKS